MDERRRGGGGGGHCGGCGDGSSSVDNKKNGMGNNAIKQCGSKRRRATLEAMAGPMAKAVAVVVAVVREAFGGGSLAWWRRTGSGWRGGVPDVRGMQWSGPRQVWRPGEGGSCVRLRESVHLSHTFTLLMYMIRPVTPRCSASHQQAIHLAPQHRLASKRVSHS